MSPCLNRFALEVRGADWSEAKKFQFGYEADVELRVRSLLDYVPVVPNARMLDLLRIASAVFFADRIVKRLRRGGPAAWPRTISLSFEVVEHGFWSEDGTRQLLCDVLRFVSGDDWVIRFEPAGGGCYAGIEQQRTLPSGGMPSSPRVCLYSGGLDSAAGLVQQLSVSDGRPIVPVCVRHRTDLGEKVRRQLVSIGRLFGHELHSVILPFNMASPSKLVGAEETSQRARAFLFVVAGAAVADGFGVDELEMFESGLGAINAPLLSGMEGSQATRGAHPHFVHLMSEFLTLVLSRRFEVVLPFSGKTKGELVASLACRERQAIAKATCTCPSFPVRVEQRARQLSCGVCMACIFRRVAMQAAGVREDASGYQYDLVNPGTSIPARKACYIAAFLNQIDSLSETERGNLPLCIEKHLHQTHVLERGFSREGVVDLYRRYREEAIEFIRRADVNGCKWTKCVRLPSKAA